MKPKPPLKKTKSQLDKLIQQLVSQGYLQEVGPGLYVTTEKGRRRVERMSNKNGRN